MKALILAAFLDFSGCVDAAQYRVNIILMPREELFTLCTDLVRSFSGACMQRRGTDERPTYDIYTLMPTYENYSEAKDMAGHELLHLPCKNYHTRGMK